MAKKSKPAGRRKKPQRPPRDLPVPRGPDVPYWFPADRGWQQLPENIRQAVEDIVAPAYRRLVLDVSDEIGKSPLC